MLQAYKEFVRRHPTLLSNAEWLVHLLVWNPDRFSNSELAYEAFNAAVGLLAVFNDSILAEKDGMPLQAPRLWLAAVQQVQTLVELRAIALEERGKMRRYGPLIALEAVKAWLRLRIWAASSSPLSLPDLPPEEAHRQAAAQQLRDLMDAFIRLRGRHSCPPLQPSLQQQQQQQQQPGQRRSQCALHGGHAARPLAVIDSVPEEDPVGSYNAAAARATAVHAAAIAPLRPPCACADAGSSYMAASGVLGRAPSTGSLSGSGSSAGVLGPCLRPSASAGDVAAALVRAGSSVAAEAAAALSRGSPGAAAGLASVASAGKGVLQQAAALAASVAAAGGAAPEAHDEAASSHKPSSVAGAALPTAKAGVGAVASPTGQPSAAAVAPAGPRPPAATADSTPAKQRRSGACPDGWLRRLRSGVCGAGSRHATASKARADDDATSSAGNTPRAPFDWGTDTRSFGQQLLDARRTGQASPTLGVNALLRSPPGAPRPPQWQLPRFRSHPLPDALWWRRQLGLGALQAGELVFILRPLVYVCLLKRYGLRSWHPWLASLALELLSSGALARGQALLQAAHGASWPPQSTLYSLALLRGMTQPGWGGAEQGELTARRLALLRYLLRSPVYDLATRRLMLRVLAAAQWVPGLRNLLEFGFNLVDGIQGYYTYVEA